MSAVPGVLLLGFLLHSVLCEEFGVSLPGRIEAVRGSCLTIPCSFTVQDQYEKNLHSGCVASWRAVDHDKTVEFTRATTGDLTQKNCTTTVHDITQQQQGPVHFRVDCGPDNPLKYIFKPTSVDVRVNEAPPTPTLTPPTLSVTEGESVSVQCSAPVPCLSLPPTLTWSPVLGDVQETLQQKQDETFVLVSTLSFTASDYKTVLTCSVVYSREDGTTTPSNRGTTTVTCAQCDKFSVNLPQNIKAVQGSCLTIPCSFKIQDKFKLDLDDKCKAEWRDASLTRLDPKQTTGDLTQKNCTTTFQNIGPHHNKQYFFRVECNNALKWTFTDNSVNIQVTEAPPTLTLTPPTLSVTEGESVSVQCSAPVPCLSLPPTLTWSPVLGDVQETLQQQQDETFVKVSTLNFTASHSHHEKNITCSVVYSKEDLSESHVSAHVTPSVRYRPRNTTVIFLERRHFNVTLKCSSDASPAVQIYRWYNSDGGKDSLIGDSHVLNIKVFKNTAVFCEAQNDLGINRSTVVQLNEQFSAKIVSSSNCSGDWTQMSCQCEAEGNPSPLIQWYFPGVSANISITSEALSDTSVRSIITVKDAQWKDPVSLLCHSSNSLGSDEQTFTAPAFQRRGRPTNTRVTVSPSGAVAEHSNVTLRCSSDASPAVQIYRWYKADGGTFSLIGNSSVLLMKASKDTTVIYCVAQNDHGTDNSTFTQLDVQYQPHNTTVTVNPSGPMEQSSIVTLTCSSDANPAVKHYRWYKTDTGSSTLIGQSAVLHISALKETSSIFCETLNNLGTDRSAVTQLLVTYRPRNTRVTVFPQSSVTEHSNVTLRCSSDASPAVQIYRWYKADGGTFTLIGNSSVLLMKASKDTAAIFCQTQNDHGTDNSTFTQLDVHYSPRNTTILKHSLRPVAEHDNVTLKCSSDANPAVKHFRWYKTDTGSSALIGQSAVLHISALKETSSIFCETLNDLGTDRSAVTQLLVTYRPRNTRVTVFPQSSVTEHSNVTLTCSSEANPAVQIYRWYKADGGTFTLIGNSSVLLMKASKDTTVIYCESQNDHGTDNSTFTQLDVQYQPHNTTVTVNPSGPMEQSSNVTLTCSSDANPAVKHYRWYKTDTGSSALIGQSAVLHISALKETSSIFCETLNDLGTDRSAVTQLLVTYRPRNTRVTVFPQSSVTEHSNLSLTCSSEANPAVQIYRWYKADGGTFSLIGNSSVLLMKASKDTAAIFCQTQNDHGTDNSTFTQLDVQYSPRNTTILHHSLRPVAEHDTVTLKCSSDANPAVKHYRWYKTDGGSLTLMGHSPVLNFKASKDSTRLYCEALNDLGTDRSTVTQLHVHYRPRNTRVEVSPRGSVTEHSNMTLKCRSDASPAVQSYSWYKSQRGNRTQIGNSAVLHIEASRDITAVFCEVKNNLGSDDSNVTHLDVQFSPQILHSSNCAGDAAGMSCSCDTEGNPVPTIQWYLSGISSNHSVSSEPLSGWALRSTIRVTKPRPTDPFSLVCHSSNSLGTDQRQLHAQLFPSQGVGAEVNNFILMAVVFILLVLVGGLLYVIRTKGVRHQENQMTDVALDQMPDSNELQEETDIYANTNEVLSVAEENIYANASEVKADEPPQSGETDGDEGGGKASGDAQADVLYAAVNWKSKSKRKAQEPVGDAQPSCSSYLEEQRSIVGDTGRCNVSEKLAECEYAQVKFKPKKAVQ